MSSRRRSSSLPQQHPAHMSHVSQALRRFIVEHLKEKVYCFVEGKVVPKLQTEAELQKEKLGTGPEGQGHAETGFCEKIRETFSPHNRKFF